MSATLFDETELNDLNALCEESAIMDGEEAPSPDVERLQRYIERRRTKIPYWPKREGKPIDFVKWGAIQDEAVAKVFALRDSGVRSVCGVAPTGFGKTRVAELIIKRLHDEGSSWLFNTHRQMLLQQTHERFESAGIQHGVRASQMPEWYAPKLPGQLAMVQSELAAIKKSKSRAYHKANMVLYDEHHANATGFPLEMWKHYWEDGAFQLGLTATPVNLGFSEEMLYFGRPSQMRGVGAIVPATFQVPDEIDVKDVKKLKTGEYSSTQLAKKVMCQQVVGSIYEHLLEYNQELRPTLGFAPDVSSARWLVDEGWERGIACCSIDGSHVYLGEKDRAGNQVVYRGPEARAMAMELSKRGSISVVWNRFVMMAGVDWPWLECLVFATAIGRITFWLQACGRGLRAYAPTGKSQCLVIDHGGNWHRFPSCNDDVEWTLGDTVKSATERKTKNEETGDKEEPVCCPKCKKPMKGELWKKNNGKCVYCGFAFAESVRQVWQTNGKLKTVKGSSLAAKKVVLADAQKLWNDAYWASVKSNSGRNSTFTQLKGRFHKEHGDRYLILPGKWQHEGKTIFYDKHTKEKRVAYMIPPAGSHFWISVAKSVNREELQQPQN